MIRLRPQAAAELEQAAELEHAAGWYTRHGGVAGKFRAAIQHALLLAHTHPDAFPIVARRDGRLVRRVLTSRFPYTVECAVIPDGILILAVRHQAQRPQA